MTRNQKRNKKNVKKHLREQRVGRQQARQALYLHGFAELNNTPVRTLRKMSRGHVQNGYKMPKAQLIDAMLGNL